MICQSKDNRTLKLTLFNVYFTLNGTFIHKKDHNAVLSRGRLQWLEKDVEVGEVPVLIVNPEFQVL